jgi:hypothetical protein
MKWIRLFVLIILMSVFIPSGIVLAASPSVDDVKVYTDYYEDGDWLIVATYNISGGNFSDCTNTSCFRPPAYTWYIQLVDSTGTALTTNKLEQSGMRPFGISVSAATAAGYTFGGNYSVKIYGAFNTPNPNASRTITATDWRGGVSAGELDKWVLQQAQIMEDYDKITDSTVDYVTTVVEWDEVLTQTGGSKFDRGISLLSTYRPDIFQVTHYLFPLGYTPTAGTTDYAEGLYDNWDTTVGPEVSGALNTAAPYFGFTGADRGRMIGALLTMIGFLSLAIIEKSVAFMVILGGVMIGVFPMATVILLVFIMAVVLIRSLFWSST